MVLSNLLQNFYNFRSLPYILASSYNKKFCLNFRKIMLILGMHYADRKVDEICRLLNIYSFFIKGPNVSIPVFKIKKKRSLRWNTGFVLKIRTWISLKLKMNEFSFQTNFCVNVNSPKRSHDQTRDKFLLIKLWYFFLFNIHFHIKLLIDYL